MATHSSILAWKNPNGQRSLADYSPWGCKVSDTTQQLNNHSLGKPACCAGLISESPRRTGSHGAARGSPGPGECLTAP